MSCNSLRDFRLKSLHTLLMFATGRLTHGLPLSIAGHMYRDHSQTPNSLAPPTATTVLRWHGNPDVSQAATVQHV